MTEHQTMNTIIHAALRRDLDRFDAALASFPAGSGTRAGQLAVAWDNLAAQLHHHHSSEEKIFFPAFRELGVDGTLIGELDAEHAAMLAALEAASASMRVLHAEPSAPNAATARQSIGQLTMVLRTHLDREERDLESFAARHATAPQLKRAQRAVRKAYKGRLGAFLAWLTDAADPTAIAALRREIPRPALFAISRVGGRHYRRNVATVWT